SMSRATPRAGLFAGCLLLVFGNAYADGIYIPLYHASYSVSRNGFEIGTARFTLSQDQDGSYVYKSVTNPTGLAALFFSDIITETSQFIVADDKLESLRYDYVHSSKDDDRSEHIRFDWEKLKADSSDGKKHRNLSIQSGVYDRALAQLAVSLDIAAGQLAETYRVLDHGTISDYHMQRGDDTELKTAAGTYQVLEVMRKDDKKKRTTTFWLAPKLDYLPVRIEQTEPGKPTISLTLTEINFDATDSK
ncbi:MAG: DUF3108 domain-containing protein, partial [Gammaproteobacteria bacterium]